MTDPGQRRHRITFQRFNGARDRYGDPLLGGDENWTDAVSVWASIKPLSGREFYAAEQSQSEVTHKIDCRYRAGLTTDMQVRFDSRRFEIVSIIDWEERHESLLIMCKELVP
nr:phage head closure protein [uncultured Oscillibacter sp.]